MECDVTVIYPLAQSYVTKYSTPGTAATLTASRKSDKYANVPNAYLFQPIALEIWAQSMSQPPLLFPNLGAKSALNRMIDANQFFCFSAFL